MQLLRKIMHSDDIEKGIRVPKGLQHRKVEILIFPVDQEEVDDTADWSAFSLSHAMRDMENETSPLYTAQDIKDPAS